jgi:hypothetical protein
MVNEFSSDDEADDDDNNAGSKTPNHPQLATIEEQVRLKLITSFIFQLS